MATESLMVTCNQLLNITEHDIHLLKVFDAVVQGGSFAEAEILLNKSKSAIGVHISTLEERLGQKLCKRGRSGFALTTEGEKIHEICRDLFSDLDKFRDRVNRVTTLSGASLSIAIDDGLLGHADAISSALARIKDASPDLFISLHVSSPERIMQQLMDRTIDVGISALPKEIPGTETHKLYEENLALYCGPGHPFFALDDADITSEMISDCEFIDLGSYQASIPDPVCARMRPMARSGQAQSRNLLILTGKMLGLLSRDFAEPWVSRGKLRAIQAGDVRVRRQFFVNVRSEVAKTKVCRNVLREFSRVFSAISNKGSAMRVDASVGVRETRKTGPEFTSS
jgi:LysR family transcriptional regulator, transcriptional activator for bauABCD operon